MNLAKFIFPVFISFAAIGITACKEEVKSVDYYMQHDDARMDKIKECHNATDDSENCINANEAMKNLQKKNTSIPRF
ncbi:EexN family lipoprotein [Acinetobacter variabilis]|uniref:EexN family lipoprotein n=1 Tax=Acinetobacter variabilis TaxID=70346 RepID=UPI0028B06718|nr:EexN family lipoprotein [Acinetobacter variabilis]